MRWLIAFGAPAALAAWTFYTGQFSAFEAVVLWLLGSLFASPVALGFGATYGYSRGEC